MKTYRFPWALAALLLSSCYGYGAPDEVLFGEAVFTQPKPGYTYTLKTYYVDPQINVMEDSVVPNHVPMPDAVKNTITTNLTALGYTEAPLATAELRIKMAALKGTGAVYYPGYWCDYWVYYGCYYDWYYAGSYKFGTVILDMGDLTAPEAAPLPSLWVSAIYGVATTPSYDTQRILDGINRAFKQASPYLDVSNVP